MLKGRFLTLKMALGLCAVAAGTSPTLAGEDHRTPIACTEFDEGKDGLCGHAVAGMARFQRERALLTQQREDSDDTDVTHCLLDIEITLSPNTVTGSNTIDVTSRIDGLTEMTLDLFSDMTVDAVSVNGGPAAYTRPTDQIVITLDQAYDTGQSFQIKVDYHGAPYHLSAAAGYSGTHGSPPVDIVASHSQPYNSPAWWPCKEAIDDKFTLDMWVTVPDWMIVASNGLLQGTDVVAGGRKRYRWYESYPISVYLVSIAATNYSTWTDYYNHAGGAMPVEFYIYPEDVSTVQPLVADMVQMIETLSDPGCFGEYPFIDEKYGIAQFEGCCGMEHQTMTSQGSFPERRNLHELAHMWWGDSITCETWHDIWLNEGFARYAESLWHEKKPGGSHTAYLDHMQLYRPSTYGGTVYRYDISSSSTIFSVTNSYNKGSWVMHMLRHVIGDADFFDALAAHRVAHEGGAADTEGFRAIVESVYGNDLSWFFQEWVYDPGAPYYRYGWKHRQVGAQHLVLLHVEQYQTTYPNFKMPIDITLNLDGGGNETHVIWHEDDVQWYVLEAGGPVNNVEFDKDTWILRGALQNVPYEASCNDPRGDANGDGHVDLRDFALFQFCYTGAGVTGVYDPDLCACFDRNDDDDIDADDYEVFVGCLDGPTAASDPACDDIPASFADDFDSDTSANWAINTSSSDTAATFAYDYSADGIPSAPRSVGGTTKGVKFESNMVLPAAIAGVTISPVGQFFSGDYTLTLDMWINANGPFPGGGIGSTEFVTAGIGSDGSTVNLHGVSGIGGWFAVDGDGGSSRDYRAYKDAAEQWVASGQYHVDTNNNSGSDLSSYFAAESPPAWQQSNYPQQSGSTSPGCAGFAWHTVTITVDATAGTVRWTIDGLDIATLDRNVGADFSITGNIALGYMDPFSSVSDNAALSFGIIDNVTVAAP